MLEIPRNKFNAAPQYQPMLRELGLDAETVFTHPDIVVWRSIPERENGTLDAELADGRTIRLHIKRYHPARGFSSPADDEARGIRALQIEKIATVPLVGWGNLTDGRSFIITEELYGYRPADKMLASGFAFENLLLPTADMAARLHTRGLHHRDLYLCHFFVMTRDETLYLALIDAGRVRRLPGWPMRSRWIIKDLAQFWYSSTKLPVSDAQRVRWLGRYAEQRGLRSTAGLQSKIERKAAQIARHDVELNRRQQNRNVSIPE